MGGGPVEAVYFSKDHSMIITCPGPSPNVDDNGSTETATEDDKTHVTRRSTRRRRRSRPHSSFLSTTSPNRHLVYVRHPAVHLPQLQEQKRLRASRHHQSTATARIFLQHHQHHPARIRFGLRLTDAFAGCNCRCRGIFFFYFSKTEKGTSERRV